MSNEKITLNTPIENLNLKTRTLNCLHRNGNSTIFDVVRKYSTNNSDINSLLKIKNFGKCSFTELIDAIHSHGFVFSNEEGFKDQITKKPSKVLNNKSLDTILETIGISNDNFTLAGIITLYELVSNYTISLLQQTVGPVNAIDIIKIVHSLGFVFKEEFGYSEQMQIYNSQKLENYELKLKNKIIEEEKFINYVKKRIESQQTMINYYQKLIIEKRNLLEISDQLDKEIDNLIHDLQQIKRKKYARKEKKYINK